VHRIYICICGARMQRKYTKMTKYIKSKHSCHCEYKLNKTDLQCVAQQATPSPVLYVALSGERSTDGQTDPQRHVQHDVVQTQHLNCDAWLRNQSKTKCASKNARVAVKPICNTPDPFSRAPSPSLIVCFYLAYSKLLKLTAASNARGV